MTKTLSDQKLDKLSCLEQ